MKTILEVKNLNYSFEPGQPCLRDICFEVMEGECLGIAGANGAGKSTLLWCLLGFLKASGSVRLFGDKVGKRVLTRIGMVFQNPEDQLFMANILDDVALPLANRGIPLDEARSRAIKELDLMGLRHVSDRPAARLSIGERKRASIAAALAGSPELLLLDEPTAELDGRSVRQLALILQQLNIALVVTSHNLDFLCKVTSRSLVLREGSVIAEGITQEILANEKLLADAHLI